MIKKKERTLKVKVGLVKGNPSFILGRISGIIDVATHRNPGEKTKAIYGIKNMETDEVVSCTFRCDATDEEWEIVKNYVLANKLYRKIIEIIKE